MWEWLSKAHVIWAAAVFSQAEHHQLHKAYHYKYASQGVTPWPNHKFAGWAGRDEDTEIVIVRERD